MKNVVVVNKSSLKRQKMYFQKLKKNILSVRLMVGISSIAIQKLSLASIDFVRTVFSNNLMFGMEKENYWNNLHAY